MLVTDIGDKHPRSQAESQAGVDHHRRFEFASERELGRHPVVIESRELQRVQENLPGGHDGVPRCGDLHPAGFLLIIKRIAHIPDQAALATADLHPGAELDLIAGIKIAPAQHRRITAPVGVGCAQGKFKTLAGLAGKGKSALAAKALVGISQRGIDIGNFPRRSGAQLQRFQLPGAGGEYALHLQAETFAEHPAQPGSQVAHAVEADPVIGLITVIKREGQGSIAVRGIGHPQRDRHRIIIPVEPVAGKTVALEIHSQGLGRLPQLRRQRQAQQQGKEERSKCDVSSHVIFSVDHFDCRC